MKAQSRKKLVSFHLRNDLLAKLQAAKVRTRRTMRTIFEMALEDFLAKKD